MKRIDESIIKKKELLKLLIEDWLTRNPGLRQWMEANSGIKGKDLVTDTIILLENGLLRANIQFSMEVWNSRLNRFKSLEGAEEGHC